MGERREETLSVPDWTAALERAQSQGEPAAIVRALRGLGQAYLDKGDAPRALTHFEEGLKQVRAAGDKVLEPLGAERAGPGRDREL
jgi:hypothetical protein